MTRTVRRWAGSLEAEARRDPVRVALYLGVIVVCCVAVVRPFTVVHYPPLVDLPFHAANTSIFRHYFEKGFHFREQFTFRLFESPYVTLYLLGAVLELFFSAVTAVKLAASVMLLLLPFGIGVLCHGMKRSPLWGVLGLAFVWTDLTLWGFVNSMGALGLFATTIGVALIVVDRPTRRNQTLLGALLLLTFFTHAFRYPFAAGGVILTALVMYPATRKFTPVLLPSLPAAVFCGLWLMTRPKSQGMPTLDSLSLGWARLGEVQNDVFNSWVGPDEKHLAAQMALCVLGAFAVTFAAFVLERRWQWETVESCWWAVGTTLLVGMLAGTSLLAFLTLPMTLGDWWLVYPREATSAGYIALALFPTLPRSRILKLLLLGAVSTVMLRQSDFTTIGFRRFEKSSADFRRIIQEIPPGSKLAYLLFDMDGADRVVSPYRHLPAWIQAEQGGWLHFHFASMKFYPVRYRDGAADVPPPTVPGVEFTPTAFALRKQGDFFDTFLIRSSRDPTARVSAAPRLHLVAHDGSWWLYRREAVLR